MHDVSINGIILMPFYTQCQLGYLYEDTSMKKTGFHIYLLLILIPLILLAGTCGYYFLENAAVENTAAVAGTPAPLPSPTPTQVPTPSPIPTPTPFPEHDITLMAVGDNLMHMGIIASGKQEDGTYDFSMLFQGIEPFLQTADLKIINQETVMGGNSRGFSGFPYFNSPTEVGDAIADAGFNVVLQASNHTADQKLDGLLYCADFWKSRHPEVLVAGIHEDTSQSGDIPLLTIEDVTFAVLNYTYSANTETLPLNLLGHLNLLCAVNERTGQMDFTTLNPQVTDDIARAKELADIVIVCPHWGTEYSSKVSRYQKKWALEMTAAGADVIIGTHPHVVEPVEWITAENGNQALCYYSLGNYVSSQKNALSMLEGMAWLTFHVTEDGVSIDRDTTGVLPLVCQYSGSPVRFDNVYLLEDYTEELAAAHGIRSYGGVALHLEDLQKWSSEILGDFILTKDQVLHNAKTISASQ